MLGCDLTAALSGVFYKMVARDHDLAAAKKGGWILPCLLFGSLRWLAAWNCEIWAVYHPIGSSVAGVPLPVLGLQPTDKTRALYGTIFSAAVICW